MAQAIRIVMEIGERSALRTDVALAERIGVIAADRYDAIAVGRDRDATGGLAQRAAPKMRLGHGVERSRDGRWPT
jgi:hypothetical protein